MTSKDISIIIIVLYFQIKPYLVHWQYQRELMHIGNKLTFPLQGVVTHIEYVYTNPCSKCHGVKEK